MKIFDPQRLQMTVDKNVDEASSPRFQPEACRERRVLSRRQRPQGEATNTQNHKKLRAERFPTFPAEVGLTSTRMSPRIPKPPMPRKPPSPTTTIGFRSSPHKTSKPRKQKSRSQSLRLFPFLFPMDWQKKRPHGKPIRASTLGFVVKKPVVEWPGQLRSPIL